MTDSTTPPTTAQRVLAALAELGRATAAQVGEAIGIAYSTTTAKLRDLETDGLAERVRSDDGTTLWQPTATGLAAAGSHPTSSPAPEVTSTPDPADDTLTSPPADNHTSPQADERIAAPAPQPDPGAETSAPEEPGGEPAAAGPSDTVEHESPVSHDDPPNPAGEDADHPRPAPAPGTNQADGRRKSDRPRRRHGELRNEVLTLLQRNPGAAYKVGEICKLLNQANADNSANKASAGAVANALDKLVSAGTVTQLDAKVATYQAV